MAIAQKTGGFPLKETFQPGSLAAQLSAADLSAAFRLLNQLQFERSARSSRNGRRAAVRSLPPTDGASNGDTLTLVADADGVLVPTWT